MRIRYQPARSTPEIEIRDLRGHKHGTWRRGEEQDFAPDETAMFREADGTNVVKSIVDALFSVGPDFVDAATNRNPFFTCAACGDVATDDFFMHPNTLAPHYIREDETVATSPRLCLPDFIARHPEHEARFKAAGTSSAVIAEARKRRDAPASAPVLAVTADAAVSAAPSDVIAGDAAPIDAFPDPPTAEIADGYHDHADDEGHK